MIPLMLLAYGGGLRRANRCSTPLRRGPKRSAISPSWSWQLRGFIFVLVEGILFYASVRFRRGGPRPESEPPQVYGSKPIEIAWTAAPGLIVFVLVLVTTRTIVGNQSHPALPRPGDHALFVTAIGHQWWWEYRYDHYDGKKLGFTTANELHIPAGAEGVVRPVYLVLDSADVCHSYWVPRLAGKTDMIPGRTNYMWFQTDQPGLYPRPVCRVLRHATRQHAHPRNRRACRRLRALAGQRRERPGPCGRVTGDGQKRSEGFPWQSCVNCHRVAGTPAQGTYAPDLTHLMSRQTLATGMVPNTPENLRQWVADPQKIKPGCLMPAFGLSDRDRDLHRRLPGDAPLTRS